jgi:hypothetical protein
MKPKNNKICLLSNWSVFNVTFQTFFNLYNATLNYAFNAESLKKNLVTVANYYINYIEYNFQRLLQQIVVMR